MKRPQRPLHYHPLHQRGFTTRDCEPFRKARQQYRTFETFTKPLVPRRLAPSALAGGPCWCGSAGPQGQPIHTNTLRNNEPLAARSLVLCSCRSSKEKLLLTLSLRGRLENGQPMVPVQPVLRLRQRK